MAVILIASGNESSLVRIISKLGLENPPGEAMREKSGGLGDVKRILREPMLLFLLLLVAALFGLFIIYPLVKIVILPDPASWARFFTEAAFLRAFRNTVFSSLLATATAVFFGFGYAYAVNYAEVPLSRFFRILVLVPLTAPSAVTGLAFIMLFGRRGIITWNLLGLRTDLYGWVGLWVAQSVAFFPLAYMTISGVLKAISPNLELAAENLGARGGRLFRTVTLPLALPGILGAFLLVAINSLADFGNPMLVAGNYKVLATEAYVQVVSMFDNKMASVLSIMLLLPTLCVFLFQRYYLEKRSYVTVTGKPVSGLKRAKASPATRFLLFCLCLLVAAFIVLVYSIVVLFTVTNRFGVDNTFTLDHFHEVFFRSRALLNSWGISLASAVIVTVLGVLVAFLVSRKRFPGRAIMDFVAMLPISMPGTFMGLALVLVFNAGWLELTGTAAIIVVGMVLRQLPVGYRNAIAAFKQIDKSIEEASTNLGANSLRTFTRVVMPMLRHAVSVSFVYSFMKCMNTLSTVIFLVSPRWSLASLQILNLADHGYYGRASATAMGMMLCIAVTFGVMKLLFKGKIHIFDI